MKFTGTLFRFDGVADRQGDTFMPDMKIKLPKTRVPVNVNFSEDMEDRIGYAKVKRKGLTLQYEINITAKQIPQSVFRQLTPCFGGKTIKRNGSLIVAMELTQIGLASDNADARIKALGNDYTVPLRKLPKKSKCKDKL